MDFGDIIIIAAAVIGMVVSAISKSAKKKAQSNQPSPVSEHEEWYDEYDEDTEQTSHSVVKEHEMHQSGRTESEYWSYDQQTLDEIESSPKINDTYRKKKPSKHETKPENSIYALDKNKPTANEGAGPGNFNLKDAIIYSELLNPKFKEY